MEKTGAAVGPSIKPFSIGYLVWHCLNMLVTLCLLGYVSVGFFSYAGWAGLAFPVLGFSLSAVFLLVLGWALTSAVALAGVLFALGSIGVWKAPSRKVATIGKALLVICAIELLLGIIQGNLFTLISKAISILLAGAILHELKRAKPQADEQDGPVGLKTEPASKDGDGTGEAHCASASPADDGAAQTKGDVAAARHLARMCEGYSLIMFFWGALRLLTGLAEIFNGGFSATDEASVRRVVSGCILAGVGIYLIAVGRYGKASLTNRGKLKLFRALSTVGLCVSVGSVVPTVIWAMNGAELSTGELFCSFIDLVLYAGGVYYARNLALVGETKTMR